ncbi:MAG: hypothetical protein KKF30_05485 [Proteobacteria bacterium]|nr:hypothetical protein [Pseudomonadota bacterium]MBU4472297.1 hypothetical protein [Pseudomonadota bacterium]MCG2751993.1 hypothetical protein [Desulfobacteraceae bacterium]
MSKISQVYSNDPVNPQREILVTGLVEKFANISPGGTIRLTAKVGEPVKQNVTITPTEKYPFNIKKVTALNGKYITFQLIPKESKSMGYSLVVENTKKDKGRYGDTVILETDSPVKPTIEIRIYGDIRDPNPQPSDLPNQDVE